MKKRNKGDEYIRHHSCNFKIISLELRSFASYTLLIAAKAVGTVTARKAMPSAPLTYSYAGTLFRHQSRIIAARNSVPSYNIPFTISANAATLTAP